jgi:GDSL-like Lipase/Acylhydrolase family
MPEPLQLPIRILLKGPSNISWMSPMGGPRSDFHFGRALEAELLGAGRAATVRTISVPSELAKTALRKWEPEVLGFSPDVIILTYGQYESVHLFLPRWLERHANSLKARPGLFREQYRKRLLRPFWMTLAKLQARLDRSIVGAATKTIRPRRCARDQERLIEQLQKVGSPLVLVFEVLPPAKRYQSWFPGMTARIAEYNKAAAAMVERVGLPNVRFFRVAELVEQHAEGSLEVAIPDGFHWTPEMHRVIGAELAHEILKWAETQEHLA